jgi:hypothetical protein
MPSPRCLPLAEVARAVLAVGCDAHRVRRGQYCSPSSVCVGRVADAGHADLVSGPEWRAVLADGGADPLGLVG